MLGSIFWDKIFFGGDLSGKSLALGKCRDMFGDIFGISLRSLGDLFGFGISFGFVCDIFGI